MIRGFFLSIEHRTLNTEYRTPGSRRALPCAVDDALFRAGIGDARLNFRRAGIGDARLNFHRALPWAIDDTLSGLVSEIRALISAGRCPGLLMTPFQGWYVQRDD